MKVRTKTNLMVEGRFIKRGEVVDESLLPERFREVRYVSRDDLDGREGRVLMLHGLVYGGLHGPTTLLAGQAVKLETIPERLREGLLEGKDYVTEWNESMQKKVQYESRQADTKLMFGSKVQVYDT